MLAAIPFRELPDRGRLEFEALVVPKVKLAGWFEAQGEDLPAFLTDKPQTTGSASVTPVIGDDTATRPPGRPHKPASPRIVQLVRELRDTNPCPCCGARMLVIEEFARGCEPRWRPTPAPIRIDTS